MCDKTNYFTFGVAHPLRRYYIEVDGDVNAARQLMFEIFGRNWGFHYTDTGFNVDNKGNSRGLTAIKLCIE